MKKVISWETAENMMNIAAFIFCQMNYDGHEEPDVDEVNKFARKMFITYCDFEGITEVEEPKYRK